MKKEKAVGPLYCVLAALIWGLSFVAQKTGAHIGTFTFNGIRTVIGGLVLLPVLVISQIKKNKNLPAGEKTKFDYKGMFKGGLVCGTVLFVASNLQQHAFTYEIEAGKVAFITALYMMLVPLFGLFLKKRPSPNVWAGIVLGVIGLYFICVKKGDFALGKGEIFSLLCAAAFAVHIIVIDKYCMEVESVPLACGQFLVAGVFSVICMFIFEEPSLPDIVDSAIPILYAGIGSSAIAFTLQIFGQKYTQPAVAALLMCLESVFAVIFGWLILHDDMGVRVLVGCGIMFAGVILTQIPVGSKKQGAD